MRSACIAILSIFLLTNCKNEIPIDIIEAVKFDYESYLLKNQDSLIPTFDFPATYKIDEVFEVIDRYTQQNCFDTFHFNYKIGSYKLQSVAVEYCNESPPSFHPKLVSLETFGNQIILNQTEIDNAEIFSKSNKYFKENTDLRARFFIVFQSHIGTTDAQLKAILTTIIDGYVAFINEEFERQNKKKISTASRVELEEFKSANSLNLMFHPFSFSIPPPPPPPPDPNNY